ncbi:MAG: potassium-transporting ATPase subunit C [Gemmatimonadota bacterium]
MRPAAWIRQHLAALRALLVLTVLTGLLYPLLTTGIAQLPGLREKANGSMVETAHGHAVGSAIIGQAFTGPAGIPLARYFQSRPSAAGDGYDPTATSASNLGPEDIVDTLPDPAKKNDAARQSLLTQVCRRSVAVGALERVDGSRPFCTARGVGAVLAVFGPRDSRGRVSRVTRVVSVNEACPVRPFLATYRGVPVACAWYGEDYAAGRIVPVRGTAPAHPRVPADAVTASGSGLDPGISPAYARLQAPRVARVRGIPLPAVLHLIRDHTRGRALGFLGEPSVNVLALNLALDRRFPVRR